MDKLFSKKYKKLNKAYIKTIKKAELDPLDHFVLQLRYLRDYFILTEEIVIGEQENLKISTIALAIAEYEAYCNCINNYYDTSNNNLVQLDQTKSKEEVRKAFEEERDYHWAYFWEMVKFNIEGWLQNA